LPLATKEGYLTKLGQIHKVWKTRWFAVCKNELKYFKNRLDASPIRTLDLQEAIEAEMDWTYDKPNLFRLVFPWRTFFMTASSSEEAKSWVDLLKWKISHWKKCKCVGRCNH
jgi:dual adaptor for phosphotyrosine/3-phosphotyrosine/3-phosphoinositide